MMKKNLIKNGVIIVAIVIFYIISRLSDFDAGMAVTKKFLFLSKDIILMIPAIYILLGLFEIWVKKETIEKHLGVDSGSKGIFWAILLASTSVGGMYVAFPVAHALHQKGARLMVVFTYLGAAALCRIPMTLFEASFLGLTFTLIRLFISIPLVIISSAIFAHYLEKRGFELRDDR